jgi:LPXTG-motif cell wall-anchored protein
MSILIRCLLSFLLLSATYNPTPYNFILWAKDGWAEQTSLIVLAGLLLVIGYIIYLRATLRAIGAFGMALIAAVFAACVWVLTDFGLITLDNPTSNVWLALFGLSLILGLGLSWSIVRRKLSGQVDIDDVDE